MNRQEKIKQAKILENQINDLKAFSDILKYQVTMPDWDKPRSFIKRKTVLSFLGMWRKNHSVEIEIPEFMVLEIAAKCKIWIDELENRINKLIPDDDNKITK